MVAIQLRIDTDGISRPWGALRPSKADAILATLCGVWRKHATSIHLSLGRSNSAMQEAGFRRNNDMVLYACSTRIFAYAFEHCRSPVLQAALLQRVVTLDSMTSAFMWHLSAHSHSWHQHIDRISVRLGCHLCGFLCCDLPKISQLPECMLQALFPNSLTDLACNCDASCQLLGFLHCCP